MVMKQRKNVFKWYARFRDNAESTDDNPRQGPSFTVRSEKTVENAAVVVLNL